MAAPSTTVNKQHANKVLCDSGLKADEAQRAIHALIAEGLIAYDTPEPDVGGGPMASWIAGSRSVATTPDGAVLIDHNGSVDMVTNTDEVIEYALALIAAAKSAKETAAMAAGALKHVFGTADVPGSTGPTAPLDAETDAVSDAMAAAAKLPGATEQDIAIAGKRAQRKFRAAQNNSN